MSGRRRAVAVLLVSCGLSVLPAPAPAKVFLTQSEALDLAFPDCEVERRTVYLTAEQKARAEELSGLEIESNLVYAYRSECDGGSRGTAYFDTHRVRTLPEVLMVVVDPEGRVARVEILSFLEPEEYIPRDSWYRQLLGKRLDEELELDRSIRNMTGATLTARATTQAVRRVLALHEAIAPPTPPAATTNDTAVTEPP